MLRCTYCAHVYAELNKQQDEFTKEVMQHVRVNHPDKWKMVKANDVWVIQIK